METEEGLLSSLFTLVVYAGFVIGLWGLFGRAGKKSWLAVVPVLNLLVLIQLAGKPFWWIVLTFIPLINLFVFIAVFKSFPLPRTRRTPACTTIAP